ncbi:MAG TPA: triose-phosphate isomerase [Gemmatimonadales bacterium]|jgi:triosephosphate isomerase
MSRLIFAANWKMHLGPAEARAFLDAYLATHAPAPGREVWLFPPAISVETVAAAVGGRPDIRVGVQNVHWEPRGAFTGETSVAMAAGAGATAALVGHSERRHVFGETDGETARKVHALLAGGLTPVLCVGEQLRDREAGRTWTVVGRQLEAIGDLDGAALAKLVIAYEPVWAIGTGKTATPADAGEVHRQIHEWLVHHGAAAPVPVLYGGSVKPDNAAELIAEDGVDGVLVGGASLDPAQWDAIVRAGVRPN